MLNNIFVLSLVVSLSFLLGCANEIPKDESPVSGKPVEEVDDTESTEGNHHSAEPASDASANSRSAEQPNADVDPTNRTNSDAANAEPWESPSGLQSFITKRFPESETTSGFPDALRGLNRMMETAPPGLKILLETQRSRVDKLPRIEMQSYAWNLLANGYQMLGDVARTTEAQTRVVELAKKVEPLQQRVFILGAIALETRDDSFAHKMMALAIEQANTISDPRFQIGFKLQMLVPLHGRFSASDEAEAELQASVLLLRKINDRSARIQHLDSICHAYMTLDNTKQALEILRQIIKVADKLDDSFFYGEREIASLITDLVPKAGIDEILAIVSEIEQPDLKASALGVIGLSMVDAGDRDKAMIVLKQASDDFAQAVAANRALWESYKRPADATPEDINMEMQDRQRAARFEFVPDSLIWGLVNVGLAEQAFELSDPGERGSSSVPLSICLDVIAKGDLTLGIKLLNKLKSTAEQARIHTAIGNSQFASGEKDQAIASWEQSVKLYLQDNKTDTERRIASIAALHYKLDAQDKVLAIIESIESAEAKSSLLSNLIRDRFRYGAWDDALTLMALIKNNAERLDGWDEELDSARSFLIPIAQSLIFGQLNEDGSRYAEQNNNLFSPKEQELAKMLIEMIGGI